MNGATQNGLDLGNPLHLQLEKDLARLTTAEPKTVGPSILKRLGEIEARFSQAGFEFQSRLRGQFQNGFAWALLKLARSAAKVTDKQLQQLLATCERLLDTGSGRDNALEAIGVALSKKRKLTKKHRELLARLVKRQEPEIIEHFGYHIWGFLRTWPDFVLDCLDRWTRRIGEEAVANALPHTFHNSWFRWLFNADKERALKLLERMLERARRSNRTELARGFLTWFALVAIQENEPRSRELVEAALSKLELPGNETEGVVQVLVGRQMPRDPKNAPPIDVFERVSAF